MTTSGVPSSPSHESVLPLIKPPFAKRCDVPPVVADTVTEDELTPSPDVVMVVVGFRMFQSMVISTDAVVDIGVWNAVSTAVSVYVLTPSAAVSIGVLSALVIAFETPFTAAVPDAE